MRMTRRAREKSPLLLLRVVVMVTVMPRKTSEHDGRSPR